MTPDPLPPVVNGTKPAASITFTFPDGENVGVQASPGITLEQCVHVAMVALQVRAQLMQQRRVLTPVGPRVIVPG